MKKGVISIATVVVRTLIVYAIFLLAVRLMGKRQVGELQLSELITTFMLSELAITPIQDLSIPIFYSIIPILFLLATEVILSFIVTKSSKFKRLFFGNPSILIEHGKLKQKELLRLRIGVSELLSELRLKDIYHFDDVEYAFLEQNGKLSVFLKKEKQAITPEDLALQKPSDGISHPIIIDGEINETNLRLAGKNQNWLQKQIKDKKKEDIFLMCVDDQSNVTIIQKEIS